MNYATNQEALTLLDGRTVGDRAGEHEPEWLEGLLWGYCSQLEPENHICMVREHRPLACRAYDCRKDERIWVDFEKMALDPDLEKQFTSARSCPEMA